MGYEARSSERVWIYLEGLPFAQRVGLMRQMLQQPTAFAAFHGWRVFARWFVTGSRGRRVS